MRRVWQATVIAAAASCSATPKLQSAGGACLLVTDCQNGLVCVKQRCSSDLSGIVSIEEAGRPPPRPPPVADDSGTDAGASTSTRGDAGGGDDGGDASDAPPDDANQDVAALE